MAQRLGRLFHCSTAGTAGTAGSWRQSGPAFSQTRSYARSAIPTFSQTSSAELNKALNQFREQLFIPFSLPSRQRASMFKKKHAKRLMEEPVTLKISDTEEYTLRPIPQASLPSMKEAMQVLRLMDSSGDWKNLTTFLTGLRTSNRKLDVRQWEWLIRKVSRAGMLRLIIACAQQSPRTGLHLDNLHLVERLFLEIHKYAQKADFKGDPAIQAQSLARRAVFLMEISDHGATDPTADSKRSPVVIGTMLELSAMRALNEYDAKDEGYEVFTYARRLIASWPLVKFSAESTKPGAMDLKLQEMIPIWNGMRKALLVHGIANTRDVYGPLKSHLEEITKAIKTLMEALPEEAKQKPLVGYKQAQLLFQA